MLWTALIGSTEEALAAWVPAPVLVGALLFIGSLFVALLSVIWRSIARRLDKIEAAIADLHKFATSAQLSSMGDRFDERVADLRERVRVLEAKNE